MTSATFINLRVNTAEQFKESVSEPSPNTKLYFTFGKTDAWANDADPDLATSTVSMVYDIWDNMIGGKRLVGSDFSHVIPRHNWTANTVYAQYDHEVELFDDNVPFYVINGENSVYKCISNGGFGESYIEPTSFNTVNSVRTADGYVWKYMYTISASDMMRFSTQDYIPIKTLSEDDGSLQWDVQRNAKEGSIEHIQITDPGDGYSNTSNVVVVITGDGTGATAEAEVMGSTVLNVIITNPGLGYTYADVSFVGGGGSGAEGRAIISPPGGHGSNPLYELGGRNILMDIRLKYSEEDVLPTTNDYRQISILKDPTTRVSSDIATVPAFSQMMVLTTSGTGSYVEDEIVYQGNSINTASFVGRVVYFDTDTNQVHLINTLGVPTASRSLIGSTSFTARVVASVTQGYLKKHSGQVLFSDNITPVIRSDDQIENFKIVFKF